MTVSIGVHHDLVFVGEGDYDSAFFTDGVTLSICEKLWVIDANCEVVSMLLIRL